MIFEEAIYPLYRAFVAPRRVLCRSSTSLLYFLVEEPYLLYKDSKVKVCRKQHIHSN